MNNLKNISGYVVGILFFLSAITFNSCDFLKVDDYFNETLKYDSIFTSKRNIERYLWSTAAQFPDEGGIFGNNYTPGPMATDEGFTLYSETEFRGMAYALGNVSPTNLYNMNTWNNMYIIIRKANTIMTRMNEATDMTALDRRNILGYALFIRAYAYYHLAIKYGPVIIVGDKPLENNEEIDYYDRPRATWDETVDYICAELEKAAPMMNRPEEMLVSNFGRPSSGAAYALVARLRLMQASPLYNPHPNNPAAITTFGNWKRSTDGVHYISQKYDEKKWAVAAMAAKRVIDMGYYSLHTVERVDGDSPNLPSNISNAEFPNGAGNIDPFRSYADMFNGETVAPRNREFIWAQWSNQTLNYSRRAFPVHLGGWNGLCVTQKIIDAYRMVDGRDIHNSSSQYPYITRGTIGKEKVFSGYELPAAVSRMYDNREMRFYASIGFSNRKWKCSSISEPADKKNFIADYSYGGSAGKDKAGYGNTTDYAITGYVLTKFIHPEDAWSGTGARRQQKSFPIIRYAEILLSYAEALNNLTETHTIIDTIANKTYTLQREKNELVSAFNQVRYRAGMPGLTDAEFDSPETVQGLLERERMIEFLFENRRYFDVRRWGKYEESEKELIRGLDTDAKGNSFYTIIPINHAKARNRLIDRKLVLFPLALDEVRKAPSLDQNPGWQD